jgi:hypothetical protein
MMPELTSIDSFAFTDQRIASPMLGIAIPPAGHGSGGLFAARCLARLHHAARGNESMVDKGNDHGRYPELPQRLLCVTQIYREA